MFISCYVLVQDVRLFILAVFFDFKTNKGKDVLFDYAADRIVDRGKHAALLA